MKAISIFFVLTLIVTVGCRPRTFTGSQTYYPSEAKYGEHEFRLWIGVDGARGQRYTDITEKKVSVNIYDTSDNLLMQRHYLLTAASIESYVVWTNRSKIELILYDFDPGACIYSPDCLNQNPKIIMMLCFEMDPSGWGFAEAPISEDVRTNIHEMLSGQSKESKGVVP